ncbi:MAG: (Fe-S)-binding protein [Prolixibacteraceae bacterium]|nr:(Fe-S)-binding protein [Prolixibacteraceae bacterium]
MTNISKNNLDTIKTCRYCPMCKQACPSAFISYRESDTPRGRSMLLHSVYYGDKEYSASAIEAVYNCFVCGSCMSWCAGFEVGGQHIPNMIRFARKDIVNRKMAPAIVEAIKASVLTNNNPYHIDQSKSFSESVTEQKAQVLYFMGSEINYKNPEIAEAVVQILKKLKVDFSLLKNEPTSGKMLDMLGYEEEALVKATELFTRISGSGCKILLVSDPLEYDGFINDFPRWGLTFAEDVKILHLSEYLAGLIKSGSLILGKTSEVTTLADSEFLGRFNHVFEAPREILKASAGENFVEMRWNREKLLSTGEAAFTFNDQMFSQGVKLGEKIRIQANDIHCKRIVTLSATAKNNIGNHTGIEAIDIAEFVAKLI